MNIYEKNYYPPIGQLVRVDGDRMHVYTKGEGENTIVLLPGLGTTAPALDFEPLVDEISKQHRVVIVEPFGYGWSDITNKERTVENIVEEIRFALQKANIEGPYILMPHSISGIYSVYYSNKYPDEIEAVIGIDATLPKATAYFNEDLPAMPSIMRYVAPTGVARLLLYIEADAYLPLAETGTYTEENLQKTKVISAWKAYNKNVVDEANELNNNIDKTDNLSFPIDMPVLFFTTKKDNVNDEGKSNVTFYQSQLTKCPLSKIVTIEGHHYLHWTHYKEMSVEVNEFTESFNDK
ncbi:alpha/beta fold hydrolase [Virgibacillus massiliensis]|nr:alpha/beta fold hydrolase [Virgibacillus massiliensis]